MQGGVGGLRVGEVSGGYNQMQAAWVQVLGDLRSFQETSLKHDQKVAKLSQLEQEIESAPSVKRELESEVLRRRAVEDLYGERGARAGDLIGGTEATSRRAQAERRLRDFEHRMTEEIPLKERGLRQGLIWSEQDVAARRGQFQQSLMVPEDLETFLSENRHLMRDEAITAVEEARLKVQQTGSKFEDEAGRMLEMRGKRGLIEDWELPLFNQRFSEMFNVEGLPQATKVGELRTRQVDLRHMIERFGKLDERIATLSGGGALDEGQAAELAQLRRQRQTLMDDGFTPRRARDLHDQLEDQIRSFQTEEPGAPDKKARRKRGRGELIQVYEARVSDMDVAELETKQNQLLSQRNDILKEITQKEADLRAVRDPDRARAYAREIDDLNIQEQDIAHTMSAGEVEIAEARTANMDLNERAAEAARINAEDEAYRHNARRRRLSWDGRAATRLTQTLTGLVGLTVLLAGVTMGLQMGIQSLVEWYMKLREQNRDAASAIRQTSTALSMNNFETNKAIEYSQALNTQLDREMKIRLGLAGADAQKAFATATDDRMLQGEKLGMAISSTLLSEGGSFLKSGKLPEETRQQIDDFIIAWVGGRVPEILPHLQKGGILAGRVDKDLVGAAEEETMTHEQRLKKIDEAVFAVINKMEGDRTQEDVDALDEFEANLKSKGRERLAKEFRDKSMKPSLTSGMLFSMGEDYVPPPMGDQEELAGLLKVGQIQQMEKIEEALRGVLSGELPVHALADAKGQEYRLIVESEGAVVGDEKDPYMTRMIGLLGAFERGRQKRQITAEQKLDPAVAGEMMQEELQNASARYAEDLYNLFDIGTPPVPSTGVTAAPTATPMDASGQSAWSWIAQQFVPRARGGIVQPGETTLVGEEGPEIVQLPAGSEVFPSGTGGSSLLPDLVGFERQWGDLDRITRTGYHNMHDAQITYLTDTERQWMFFWHNLDQTSYEGWADQSRVADSEGPSLIDKVKALFGDLFGGFELPELEWPTIPDLPELPKPSLPGFSWPSLPDFSWPSIPDIPWPGLPDWITSPISMPEISWPSLPSWLSPSWAPWSGLEGWSFPTIEWPVLPEWMSGTGIFSGFQAAVDAIIIIKDSLVESFWGEDALFRKLFTEFIPGIFTGETWIEMYENMKVPFNSTLDWFEDKWSSAYDKITGPVKSAVDWVEGKMSGAVDKVNSWIGSYNDFSVTIPGFGFTAKLPSFTVPMGPLGSYSFGGWERKFQVWAEQNISLPDLPTISNPFGSGGYTGDFSELDVPGAYLGGMIKSGGATLIGEHGPEIMDFPTGARISPLPASGLGGGGGDVIYIEVPVSIGTRQIKRELIEVMNGTVRERAPRLI